MALVVRMKHTARRSLDRLDAVACDLHVGPSVPYPTRRIHSMADWVGSERSLGASLDVVIPAERSPLGSARSLGDERPDALRPLVEHYVPREGLVLTQERGWILGQEGAVVTPAGEVVIETVWTNEIFEASVPRTARVRRPIHLEGSAVSLVAPWWSNWFHWVINTLPRIRTLEEGGLRDVRAIIPSRISLARRRSLEMMGIDLRTAVPHLRQPIQADTLVWPSSGTDAYYASTESVSWLRERARRTLGVRPRRRSRLYLSRPLERVLPLPRGHSRRAVVNEAEVIRALSRHGFQVVRPETLTFDEQVDAFANAEIVVAPHGAGNVNVVFAERLALVELFEPEYVDPSVYAVACAAGHDYWYVMGRTVGRGDIDVPIELLESVVSEALAAIG